MVRDGCISLDQAAAAAKELMAIADFDPARESVAPYFIDYVNRLAESGTGVTPADPAQDAQATITTLDLDLQQLAAQAIQRQLPSPRRDLQTTRIDAAGSTGCADPRTGNVVAMVGGRDYGKSQLNRARCARQPGSVFKPSLAGSRPRMSPSDVQGRAAGIHLRS
jgi:membrane peptidoglycan carboxypeptidase